MTETTRSANGRGDVRKNGRKNAGLVLKRVFSSGVHPYDEVTWERRDVVQTNWKTGETVFEQHGVEFPALAGVGLDAWQASRKSVCHERRRFSPSVIDLSPTASCLRISVFDLAVLDRLQLLGGDLAALAPARGPP